MKEVICKTCGLKFRDYSSHRRVFCSRKCRNTQVVNTCVICGTNFRIKSYRKLTAKCCSLLCRGKYAHKQGAGKDFLKGHVPWNLGKSLPYTVWNKGKPYFQLKGENNPNWKGGITPINRAIRTSLEYKLWRSAIFERDNYTCQNCNTRGGVLHADHIKPFAIYPEVRFAIDNGRTLCKSCHLQTPTYGNRK